MNSLVNELPSLHHLLYITAAVLSHYEILSHELSERSVGDFFFSKVAQAVGGGVHVGDNVQIDSMTHYSGFMRLLSIAKNSTQARESQRVSLFHLLVTLVFCLVLKEKTETQHKWKCST